MTVVDVSVIIPCYKSIETIERAVHSVYQQLLRPAEVIVVDDCSPDETLSFLYSLRDKYPCGWLKVVALSKNQGAGSARNYGWDLATQKYIAFLDSDDSWHPCKISIQYNWMVANPAVSLSAHSYSVISQEDVGISKLDVRVMFNEVSVCKMLMSNQFSTPTVMLRRDLEFRFKEGKRYSEDYLLWLEIALSGASCYKADIDLSFLYKSPFGAGGLSGRLLSMELGEIDTYKSLWRMRKLSFVVFLFCCSVSIIKFFVRYLRNKVFSGM